MKGLSIVRSINVFWCTGNECYRRASGVKCPNHCRATTLCDVKALNWMHMHCRRLKLSRKNRCHRSSGRVITADIMFEAASPSSETWSDTVQAFTDGRATPHNGGFITRSAESLVRKKTSGVEPLLNGKRLRGFLRTELFIAPKFCHVRAVQWHLRYRGGRINGQKFRL